MYYRIIPFKRTFDTFGLIYSIPEELIGTIFPGNIVEVPLRNTSEIGLVIEKIQERDVNCKKESIKNINAIVSNFVFLNREQLKIIDFVSQYYISPIHHALSLYFPKNLVEKILKNTIEKIKIREYSYSENINISLTKKQEEIYNEIQLYNLSDHRSDSSEERGIKKNNGVKNKFLIYGVTGSGKTQIYMKIIEKNLKEGKQSLLLIPEIILTSQIATKVKKMFGEDVVVLHSGVAAAKKSRYWMEIHSGEAKIIIGTRSALFYPYNNLASIIIDEEHDRSYISDATPRYHSLDVAEKLSELTGASLILGSGTPRVTTFYRGLKGEFQVLQLLEKFKD